MFRRKINIDSNSTSCVVYRGSQESNSFFAI